jgi:cytoskeleton protein RodZ
MSEVASDQLSGAEHAPNVDATSSTLGARLATERMAREWTIEHVASQLNLAARQIQALETDNYAALPGMASVRGFVRAYAKLLKIDATPLVAMIASEQITPTLPLEPKRQLAAAPFSDNRMMSTDHRRSSAKTILVGIVVVLLAFGAIIVERLGGWPTLSQSLSTQYKELSAGSASNTNVQSPTEESSVSAVLPSSEITQVAASTITAASASQAIEPAASEGRVPEASPTAIVARQSEGPAVANLHSESTIEKTAGVAKGLLVLTVRKDSWVEVRAGKDALLSRLMRAGSTEQVEVTEPASLTLGNAAGVDVTFRGNPVDVKAEAKNNVARLNLK